MNNNFKWSWNVDQRAIMESGLKIDIIDFSILQMLNDFATSQFCKTMTERGVIFYMFRWKLIKEQLPILNLNTRQSVKKRIDKLINAGILIAHPENQKTRSSWFCFGENKDSLYQFKSKPKLPSVNESYQKSQQSFTHTDNNRLHDNTNNNNKDNNTNKSKSKKEVFVEPTLSEVKDYCKERNVKEEFAEEFMDFNTNRDWKLSGGRKMKCWKTTFRTAMRKDWNQKYKISTKNLVIDYAGHLQKNLKEKKIKSMNGQIAKWDAQAKQEGMFARISALRAENSHITNPTYTNELVFDFCYGSLSNLGNSGTTPEKAVSKFRQFYNKLSDYKQNKSNLRTEYFNFLTR